MTVSEYLVTYLSRQGVDSAFAVIGSTAMWLFHALGDCKGIRTICTNHEQAAAMAADGWSCLKGIPGAVFLTNGPGVTNALTGVAQAWTDSVPLVVISGESKTTAVAHEIKTNMRQYGPQDVRTDLITAPFVKYYHLLENPKDTRKVIEEAYDKAMKGRPGPVWISVPVDIQNLKVPEEMEGYAFPQKATFDTRLQAAQVKTALLGAKRPLVIAGQGVRLGGAVEQLKAFLEKYQIPVVTSRMGNDVIESRHPLFVGRPGNWGNRASHFAIQTADVILVLGSRLALNTTGPTPSAFAPQARKFVVDIDPIEFEKPGITFNACIQQDVSSFLREMEQVSAPETSLEERKAWCVRCAAWRAKYPVVAPEYHAASPMSTYHFIDRLSAAAAENDVVMSDTGSCCNIVSQVWDVKKGQRLRVSGGLSCMGYWATSIGMARAQEGQPGQVLCVVGDGSFQMNLQELGTVAHYQLPIKIFVINNNGYQIIRISQNAYMHGDFFAISPETGVGLANTEKIAAAYGIPYHKADKPEDADKAIRWALEQHGPAIVEAVVGEDQLTLPRLSSRVQADGTFKSADYADLSPFLPQEELDENLKGQHTRDAG